MKVIWSVAYALIVALFLNSAAHAVTVGKTELPDTWKVGEGDGEIALVLNGAGMREYGFLRIAVYAGALYVRTRETDANKLLDSNAPRVVHMKMLRDVSREDSAKAWVHYLEANCTAPCDKKSDAFKVALAELQRVTPETKAGDTQTFIFQNGMATWQRNGAVIATFKDVTFTRALLACWIGDTPTTVELKDALLGKAKR
jgi:hypothetical protein